MFSSFKGRFKFVYLLVICAALFSGTVFSSSIEKTVKIVLKGIKINIDGKEVTPKDAKGNIVEPFVMNGTTYLPVRAVGEALNKEVAWDAATNTIYIRQPGQKPSPSPTPIPHSDSKIKNKIVELEPLDTYNSSTAYVKKDGQVMYMGYDYAKVFDTDTVKHIDNPVLLPELSDIVKVRVGVNGTGIAALDKSGKVWEYKKSKKILKEDLSNITDIERERAYFALKEDGTVWIWGHLDSVKSYIGYNLDKTLEKAIDENKAVQFLKLNNVTSFFRDINDKLYVRKSDGSIWTVSSNPEKLNISKDASVSSQSYYTELFIKSDGSVWGKGENSKYQLGVELNNLSKQTNDPVQIPGFKPNEVIALQAFNNHSLFLKNDGTVWACGEVEILSNESEGKVYTRSVEQLPGVNGVKRFFYNDQTLYFLSDNDLLVWRNGDTINSEKYYKSLNGN
ncbi:MAG: stalk domain-containing protein [Clostridia bacterium]|nr:stalk domain-containing protein [Clostridia bacterium]